MTNPRGKRWRPSAPIEIYRQNQALEAREANRQRLEGWPVMRGTPEERERRYLRALYEGLRAETKIRSGQ